MKKIINMLGLTLLTTTTSTTIANYNDEKKPTLTSTINTIEKSKIDISKKNTRRNRFRTIICQYRKSIL